MLRALRPTGHLALGPPPAPRVGPGRLRLAGTVCDGRGRGRAAELTPAESWALSRPRFLPLCWVAAPPVKVPHGPWPRMEHVRLGGEGRQAAGSGGIGLVKPNPLGRGGHARPPVAGRIDDDGSCTRHCQLEAGLRLHHRRLPAQFLLRMLASSMSRALDLNTRFLLPCGVAPSAMASCCLLDAAAACGKTKPHHHKLIMAEDVTVGWPST